MIKNIYEIYNIDTSRLTRDYISNPLYKEDGFHLSEYPDKNDFYYLYIVCNVRRSDLSKYFCVGKTTIDNMAIKFGIKKSKKLSHKNSLSTCLERYGKENVFQVDSIKQKQVETVYNKYGVKNVSMLDKVKAVKIETTRANNTFSSSKPEEIINMLLLKKFIYIIRQYQSDLYPFPSDFYIPSQDLYIEYQGSWCHGGEPYNSENRHHLLKVKHWLDRGNAGHPRYFDSIKTWTVKDPLKRKTAKENKLNWLEFFNLKDFMTWYNNLEGEINV